MSYIRQFHEPEDGPRCVVCSAPIEWDHAGITCSVACSDIQEYTRSNTQDQWNYDAEEVLYA